MPSAGLLALLDDITSLLDDVAAMTKVASKKTAAVVGDDLALNANALVGFTPARELPIVWGVAKGSLINNLILIPAALLITAFVPALIYPLLMLGGAFLCYEGTEKVLHKLLHSDEHEDAELTSTTDPAELERQKIRGAILTDFILSAEILVIALGAASGSSFSVQALTLITIGLGMTVIVYGMVALIVKADDAGLHLQTSPRKFQQTLGRTIVSTAPKMMKLLSILGTAAMFLVGGEIVAHGIHPVEEALANAAVQIGALTPAGGMLLGSIAKLLMVVVFGVIIGLVVIAGKKSLQALASVVRGRKS